MLDKEVFARTANTIRDLGKPYGDDDVIANYLALTLEVNPVGIQSLGPCGHFEVEAELARFCNLVDEAAPVSEAPSARSWAMQGIVLNIPKSDVRVEPRELVRPLRN
jgi:hypothetical protein